MKTKVLLKFADDKNYYRCEIQRMTDHMVKVIGLIQDLSGFQIFSDAKTMIGDYSKYTFEYKNPNLDENVFEYTDNDAVYPDEGADKSLRDQILDEAKSYTDSKFIPVATVVETLNDDAEDVKDTLKTITDASKSQLNEIQESVLDMYMTLETALDQINQKLSEKDDTTSKVK